MIKVMRDASSRQLHALHIVAVEGRDVIVTATRSLTQDEAKAIMVENLFGTGDSPTFEDTMIDQHPYTLWSRRVKWLSVTEEELVAFKITGTFKHHHSGQVHRLKYRGLPFDPANIVWISQSLPTSLPGVPEAPEAAVDGGAMLLSWAKMQLWEEIKGE